MSRGRKGGGGEEASQEHKERGRKERGRNGSEREKGQREKRPNSSFYSRPGLPNCWLEPRRNANVVHCGWCHPWGASPGFV